LTYVNKPWYFSRAAALFRMGRALTLFKKIMKLFSGRIFIAFCHSFRCTIFELEIIAEVGSILIKDPLGLGLTALIVVNRVVVAAVEAAAQIHLAQRADVFPSYYLGNIYLVFTVVAQRHIKVAQKFMPCMWGRLSSTAQYASRLN
jgi:hypothetical protein